MKHLGIKVMSIALSLAFLTACGGDGKKKEEVNIAISPATANVHVGKSASFTVTVTGSSNTGFELLTSPATGAGCSINGTTVTCAPTAADNYTLTVTAKADTTKTKTATLNVTEVSISISPTTTSVDIGQSATFTVTAQNTDFSVSVSPETGAGCVRADNTVVCTPTAAEEYTLTVTATEDSTKTATATFPAVVPGPEEVEGMVYVAAGTFTMGCEHDGTYGDGKGWNPSNCTNDSRPAHTVTLTRDFYIGRTELTQAEWEAVMGSNPSEVKGANLPVTDITRNDAHEFIDRLNARDAGTGKTWRLPTEAEWEYAARGGSEPKNCEGGCLYSGSADVDAVAWYMDNSGDTVHPVRTKAPNELGLYDMNGNVREFVEDFWVNGGYGSADAQTDPTGPDTGLRGRIVIRGGSYKTDFTSATVVNRGWWTPDAPFGPYGGFRLALTLAEPDAQPASITSAAPASTGFFDGIISGVKSLWNSITK